MNEANQIVASNVSTYECPYEMNKSSFVPGAKSMTSIVTALIYVQGETQEQDMMIVGDKSGKIRCLSAIS